MLRVLVGPQLELGWVDSNHCCVVGLGWGLVKVGVVPHLSWWVDSKHFCVVGLGAPLDLVGLQQSFLCSGPWLGPGKVWAQEHWGPGP